MAYLLLFLTGACFGSFLTVVAERLPLGLSLIKPSSHCTKCQQSLSPLDLLPIYAFIRLKGCCRHCHQAFSNTSFLMECYWGSLVCLLFYLDAWQLHNLPLHILLISSCLLSLTDYLYWLVEPKILYSSFFFIFVTSYILPKVLTLHLSDALTIYCLLLLLRTIKKDSLGSGDVKLLTGWTFFLGHYAIAAIVLIGSSLALLRYLLATDKEKQLPFVPYLSAGLLLYLLHALAH